MCITTPPPKLPTVALADDTYGLRRDGLFVGPFKKSPMWDDTFFIPSGHHWNGNGVLLGFEPGGNMDIVETFATQEDANRAARLPESPLRNPDKPWGATIGLIAALCLLPGVPARAQSGPPYALPYIQSCIEQDSISIRDEGPDKAIVTYSNSIEECSSPVTLHLTAPNGIKVRVTIQIGDAETITLEPEDPLFMSIPPEGDVPDGEKQEFLLMGGMS
jgi:hypothetical protein